MVELGIGLLSIGRIWGINESPPPTDQYSFDLMKLALTNGISFFDTAPAYGRSEDILGKFLESLNAEQRNHLCITTKAGEFWHNNKTYVDHRYHSLQKSIDSSIQKLKKIDILQIHKSTPKNVISKDVEKAIIYAQTLGINKFGVSVSDLDTARVACKSHMYHYIQFPFNIKNQELYDIFNIAEKSNMEVIINRPLNMGALTNTESSIKKSFNFILNNKFKGVILTGTSSKDHLAKNINIFNGINTLFKT